MITPSDSLLAPNASPLEHVVAAAGRRIQAIPAGIEEVKRAAVTPSAFLPFAAWEYSVDVWFGRWPETTKRNIAARSLQLHQKKGTLYAISEYARYAGGTVLSVERPPMRIFSGPSLTREQREAWLRQLPQVRVFLFNEPGRFGPAKSFYGGRQHNAFFETAYPVSSTALSRLRRRARWVVEGVETEVKVTEFGSYFQLRFAGRAGQAVYCNRVYTPSYFIPSTAWRRVTTIQPVPRLAWRSPVSPTLQAVEAEPARVTVPGTRGPRVFCDTPLRGWFVPSTARYRIFDRYAVNDGSTVLRRPACTFSGVGRYGFPRHTAWLRMSIPGRRSRFAAGEGITVPRTRFWLPHDGSRVEDIRRAIQSAKRLSDRIMLDLGPKPRFVAGRPFIAGVDSLVVGRP